MNLNQIAASIANNLNQPFNHELIERAKDLFKQELAMYIRQSVERHGIDDTLMISYNSRLIKVPKYEYPANISDELIVRTEYKVPTPVRIKNDSPFMYVGTIDGMHSLPLRSPREAALMHSYSSIGSTFSYYFQNSYIIINHRNNFTYLPEYILIKSIFESPEQVLSMYDDVDGQDIELPIPMDIIPIFRNKIMQILGAVKPESPNVSHNPTE